ncbi:MAG TPA: 50S ribosomal protein L30 [Bacteroidales bacterium]|nr:50S ribosomal protein L30 [Bacteroidales bacterium]HNS46688.1 50S ribosomal protein L30 [Bacteroidales bacterium]
MNRLRVTQIKSGIGKPQRQKRTLEALGIKRMHQTVEVKATPQILGMIEKVRHLVTVEEIQ